MRRNTFLPAAVAGFALVVLGACGGDDETASAGAQPSPQTTDVAPTTAATAPPTTTAAAPATTAPRCTNVSFSANVEDVASDIRPTGLACAEAEAFVRKVGAQLGSATGPARVESDGFVCIRASVRSGDHGPPLATFDCTSGARKVVFVRALVS